MNTRVLVFSHELIFDFIGYGLIIVLQGFLAAFKFSIRLFPSVKRLKKRLVLERLSDRCFIDLLGLSDIKTRLIWNDVLGHLNPSIVLPLPSQKLFIGCLTIGLNVVLWLRVNHLRVIDVFPQPGSTNDLTLRFLVKGALDIFKIPLYIGNIVCSHNDFVR